MLVGTTTQRDGSCKKKF